MQAGTTRLTGGPAVEARFGLCCERRFALVGGNTPSVESTLKLSNCNWFTRSVRASCRARRSP